MPARLLILLPDINFIFYIFFNLEVHFDIVLAMGDNGAVAMLMWLFIIILTTD